jgi:hypothetical protein
MSEATTEKAGHVTPARAERKCDVEGCKRPYRAKGYCVTHYKKWRRGELEAHRARYKICSKEACRKPAGAWGLCDEHRKTGEGEAAAAT